jgi:CBS domain-containing membrane protein
MKSWLIQGVRWSATLVAGRRELCLGTLGVGLGIWLTEWISRWTLGMEQPWFVIPMGASAVLLFAVPASPLAQPWAVLGGNVLSALCGTACQLWLGSQGETIALAAAAAVALMFALRCLHPPGGAMALTAVLGGPAIASLGWSFAWIPVALNSCVLVVLAVVFNRLAGRQYPHHPAKHANIHATQDLLPSQRGGIRSEDLDAALASYGELLDVDRGDLEEILIRAQVQAHRRHMGQLRCQDIMSRDLVTVRPESLVQEAWEKLAHHRIKSLPVIDHLDRLEGIVSVPDFFIDRHQSKIQVVPRVLQVKTVQEIMTRRVVITRADQLLSELIEIFSDSGLHHIPVVDSDDRLVGMVTQSDLVGALISQHEQA